MLARVLVLVVAVAVLADVSQAILPALKRAREMAFKRYVEDAKAKMVEGSKRQWMDFYACPLFQCYFQATPILFGDEGSGSGVGGFEGFSCSDTGKCMQEKLDAGNVCNCSLNDIVWAQREAEYAETCDLLEDYSDDCYECYGELPDNVWNPQDLAFSCDKEKVDNAERCFSKMKDSSCLNDLMAGYEVQPKYFFEGIRQEMDGCPLSSITWNCLEETSGYYGDYASCAMSYAGLEKTKQCVKDMTGNLPTCNLAEDMYEAMDYALDSLVTKFCAPIEEAIGRKAACCEAADKRAEEAEKEERGQKFHKFHKIKRGQKFHKFHKASVLKKVLSEAGLI